MINLNESILVKSDINKVWAFITDFSHSMVFNRFHKTIELPDEYSIKTIDIYKGVIPFVIIQLIVLSLIAKFPQIALWLPNKLY